MNVVYVTESFTPKSSDFTGSTFVGSLLLAPPHNRRLKGKAALLLVPEANRAVTAAALVAVEVAAVIRENLKKSRRNTILRLKSPQ